MRKLTPDDVRAIRLSTEPCGVLASRYAVRSDTIHAIRARDRWAQVADIKGTPSPVNYRQGQRNHTSKLTPEDVRAIRRSPEPEGMLAKKYGVHPTSITNVRARLSWKHLDDPSDIPPIPYPEERWHPVTLESFEHLYEVSDGGHVRHADQRFPRRPLCLVAGTRGYINVRLSRPGRIKVIPVHRLVARAFLGPPPPGHGVNHKDGDKRNNRLMNLEYLTNLENHRHARRLGLYKKGLKRKKPGVTKPELQDTHQ